VRIGELSRGIHPAVLSTGGLGPALRGLARRAPVPVTFNVGLSRRPPERIEVAVYFIVAEALTNVAKHAHASNVPVDVQAIDGGVRVSVSDDGVGGADPVVRVRASRPARPRRRARRDDIAGQRLLGDHPPR
jgi:signal transduction histidine kinase